MSFDPKCYELAKYFIDDVSGSEAMKNELAQRIQEAVEDWFFDLASKDAVDHTTGEPA